MKIQNRNLRLNLGLNSIKKCKSQSNSVEHSNTAIVQNQSQRDVNSINNLNISSENNLNNNLNLNQCANADNDLAEDEKLKQEARELIEKTKNMMKDLSNKKEAAHKKSSGNLNINNNPSCSSTNFRCLSKEKNYNFDLCNMTTINSKENLPQQLFNKNKEIKQLEKELKDKTQQLKICQQKLQSKNEEIIKLNEALTLERSNNLKADNIKLQRKVFTVEKSNEENKKTYERLIENLKSKLSNASTNIGINEQKIVSLEKQNKELNKDKDILINKVAQANDKVKQMNEKLEVEKKANENKDKKIQELKTQLSNLCAVVKSLYQKENNFYNQRENFNANINSIFDTPFHCGSMIEKDNLMGSTDFGYNRKQMNNSNVIFPKPLNYNYTSTNNRNNPYK